MSVTGGGDGWRTHESPPTERCSTDSLGGRVGGREFGGVGLPVSADALTVGGTEGNR